MQLPPSIALSACDQGSHRRQSKTAERGPIVTEMIRLTLIVLSVTYRTLFKDTVRTSYTPSCTTRLSGGGGHIGGTGCDSVSARASVREDIETDHYRTVVPSLLCFLIDQGEYDIVLSFLESTRVVYGRGRSK